MKEVDQRLKRLIESDICQAENYEKYREELLQLTQKLADPKTIRRQSNLFKALSDENRLKILKLLELREMCVCELMIALDMTQPNISHHLRILENQDIVHHRKKGKWTYYSLTNQKNIKNMIKIGLL
ncbi:MAG: metalloregulator ArsR/SmtB family transcription factor [Candidatus Bathyarchaeota archaeon]|jgi:ArsR family transcriptional regulator